MPVFLVEVVLFSPGSYPANFDSVYGSAIIVQVQLLTLQMFVEKVTIRVPQRRSLHLLLRRGQWLGELSLYLSD